MLKRGVSVGEMVDVLESGKVFLSNVLLEEIKTNLMGWKKSYRCRGVLTPTATGSAYIADVWEIQASPEIELRPHEPTEEASWGSIFMEECEKMFCGIEPPTMNDLYTLILLVDKHKADKEKGE